MLYNKKRTFCAITTELYYCGVGILDPTAHNYEDAYADGFLQVCDFYTQVDGTELTSRVCWCKVNYYKGLKPYFRHNGRRYWLDEFERCII